MKRRIQSTASILGVVLALFVVASPGALGAGDKGEESSAKGQATAEGNKSKAKKSDGKNASGESKAKSGEGTPGATAGTNGNKAEQSETGTKPFDNNPNDHPSGKDKETEPGGSGTQGKSASDPDGMANGGTDKPCADGSHTCAGHQGGTFGDNGDHDGNNGCGNDDDFEDDNNGWCGKPVDTETSPVGVVLVPDQVIDLPKNTPNVIVNPAQPLEGPIVHDEVLGSRITRAAAPRPLHTRAATAMDRVLGAVLPFTGSAGIVSLAIVAIVLMTVGALALRLRRSNS